MMKHLQRAIAFSLVISAAQSVAGERPNFVFFLSDDQLKADYGCYGLPVDLTPTVDRLAREGLVFDKMFTAEAIGWKPIPRTTTDHFLPDRLT